MRLLSNLHVKGKPAVLPDRAISSQSHYFIYRPCIHISESVETVYELPLLPNKTLSKTFLHKLEAERSVDWIFIAGVPVWR